MKRPAYLTDDNKIRWHSDPRINRTWMFGRLKINFRMTAGNGAMGRLGGGWSWKLGAMGSGNEVVLEVIAFSMRFTLLPNTKLGDAGGQSPALRTDDQSHSL